MITHDPEDLLDTIWLNVRGDRDGRIQGCGTGA
jgi:hypothetical protein